MTEERAALKIEKIDKSKITKNELAKRKKKQLKFISGSDTDKYTLHVYQVFKDLDFQKDVKDLRKSLEQLYYKDISLITSYNDDHLLMDDKQLIKNLADKYCIDLEDFGIYADGLFDEGILFGNHESLYGRLSVEYMDKNHFFCYKIGPKTTLEQITREWPYIREMRQVVYEMYVGKSISIKTKNKSPQNPELIYAIFKARSKNIKFSEIFKTYQNGKLYKRQPNTVQFNNDDSLERYYRKYQPQRLENNLIDEHLDIDKRVYEAYSRNLKADT